MTDKKQGTGGIPNVNSDRARPKVKSPWGEKPAEQLHRSNSRSERAQNQDVDYFDDFDDTPKHSQKRSLFWPVLIGLGLLIAFLFYMFPDADPDSARLFKLSILALLLGAGLFRLKFLPIGQVARYALSWALIAAIAGFVYSTYDLGPEGRERPTWTDSEGGEPGFYVVRRGADGHFWLRVTINGTPIRMLVDTGATNMVLSKRDARRVGIDPAKLNFAGRASTANGSVAIAFVRGANVEVGETRFDDVVLSVNAGELDGSLLGMSLLRRFASVEFQGDKLILTP